jgi:EAL domain-containing protein (putative c-di-GMP-specific phosphodiesterase class I)
MNATCRFNSLDLSSRFQPIFGVAERRAIGYEALLTARDPQGLAVSPAELFGQARARGESAHLDWVARALHLRNFHALGVAPGARLFVNVSPCTALQDLRFPRVFGAVMETLEVDPALVVIEILEDPVDGEARLSEAVAYYRRFGCAIALDDFDAGIACGERLARLQPDVVKVARDLVKAAGVDGAARDRLCETVATIHAFGAAAVLEGVETRAEAEVALQTGAGFVQGYYFARPSTQGADEARATRCFAELAVSSARAPWRAPRRGPWRARAFGTAF